MYALRKIWKPEIFQGAKRTAGYFEGWYFKCISRDETAGYAFIPGISYAGEDSHAFLQVFDGKNGAYYYLRYPLKEISYSRKELFFKVGDSEFTGSGLQLAVDSSECSLHGNLEFSAFKPWPVRIFSPGAMGWYAFVPKMQDYHGVLSFYHEINGSLQLNGVETDFTGGTGYIEKDWGTSFPSRWIWMQTNNYPGRRASLSVSVATIPWRKRQFTGYIAGFWLDGELYPFSTYCGGKVTEYNIKNENTVELVLQTRRYTLRVTGVKIGGIDLKAPVEGNMTGHVHESLQSEIETELTNREDKTVLFAGKGTSAGIELHGDINGLLSEAVHSSKI